MALIKPQGAKPKATKPKYREITVGGITKHHTIRTTSTPEERLRAKLQRKLSKTGSVKSARKRAYNAMKRNPKLFKKHWITQKAGYYIREKGMKETAAIRQAIKDYRDKDKPKPNKGVKH